MEEKGFFILPSMLFENVRKEAGRNPKDLNEKLEQVFAYIEGSATGTDSEDDLAGLFDDMDVNSNKRGVTAEERNKRLVRLLDDVGDMKLGDYQKSLIDAFGDVYEFLMGMYASNARKSGR